MSADFLSDQHRVRCCYCDGYVPGNVVPQGWYLDKHGRLICDGCSRTKVPRAQRRTLRPAS